MTDILGPADAVGAVTSRPADDRSFGALDSWFRDCTSETVEDGTDFRASFFNGLIASLRNLWRSNGLKLDGATPVVAEIGSADDAITRAVQYLIQRGRTVWAIDSGTASAIVVSLTPAPELKAGLAMRIVAAAAPTGASTVVLNGGAAKDLIHTNSFAPTSAGAWLPGSTLEMTYDGTRWMLTSVSEGRPQLNSVRTYYVKATAPGSDANDGLSTGTPFATWQKAVDTLKKLNTNGFTVTVQGLGGTYGAGCVMVGPVFGGGNVVFLGTGDLIVCGSGSPFASVYGAEFSVGAGITVQSNDLANGGITAQFGGIINVTGDVHFNACTGYQIGALDGGNIRLRAGYTVYGGGAAHIQMQGQGRVTVDTAGPITPGFGPGINYGGAFIICRSLSYALLGSYHPTGAVTGPRYAVGSNSVIDVQGQGPSFLPGNAPGINDDGTGVYQ